MKVREFLEKNRGLIYEPLNIRFEDDRCYFFEVKVGGIIEVINEEILNREIKEWAVLFESNTIIINLGGK
jgi:hypothetical protein